MTVTDAAAAVRATKGWPECTARCGWPLDPAAAAGGHDQHPICEQPQQQPAITDTPPTRRHQPLRVIQGGKTTRTAA